MEDSAIINSHQNLGFPLLKIRVSKIAKSIRGNSRGFWLVYDWNFSITYPPEKDLLTSRGWRIGSVYDLGIEYLKENQLYNVDFQTRREALEALSMAVFYKPPPKYLSKE